MYPQFDFSKDCELISNNFDTVFYREFINDLRNVSDNLFNEFSPCFLFFPFEGNGRSDFTIAVVRNALKHEPETKPNTDELLKRLSECRKAINNLATYPLIVHEFQEDFNKLVDQAENEIKMYPEYKKEHFEEIYCSVLSRVKQFFGEARDITRIFKLLEKIKQVHIDFYSGFSEKLYGKYIPNQHRIELYADTISAEFDNDRDRTGFLFCVLSHELFHLWHHTYVRHKDGKWSSGKRAKAVKESLARYFEFAYSRNSRNISAAVKDKTEEMMYPMLSMFPKNPYHGAQYMNDDTFITVLKMSAYDMSDAFDVLKSLYLINKWDL